MATRSVNHGGRALAFARERGLDYKEVLDFSANINPLGASAKVIAALRESLDLITVYPDEKATRLTHCLADHLRVSADRILPGNGATELIHFWLRTVRPRSATLVVPTFSEYRFALQNSEVEVGTVTMPPGGDFHLPAIRRPTDVVILTNPNNPTGSYIPPEIMRDWIRQIPSSTQIFLDEAFVEFTAQPSLVRSAEEFSNLWILRSLTKFYAIPGLRLGYLVGQGVPSISKFREPWQINNLAEIAGIASLEDRSYAEATMQLVQKERIWLWKQLQDIAHFRAFPTAANFFLARCDSDSMLDKLIATLADENILIRDCRDVEGLDGPYFRFAIKTRPDNIRLLGFLRDL